MPTKYYKIRGKEQRVIDGVFEYEGLKFNVRDQHQGACDVGIVMNCIDRDGFSYWHLAESYRGVVIDIGAHIGGFTCAVAKQAKRVYAFEASTDNYELLVKNVALNKLDNVECFHRAVGTGKPTRISFSQSTATSPSTLRLEGRDSELIPGISLDQIIELSGDDIELMKIDCEGSEYDLFLGKDLSLVRSIEMMAAEVHAHPDYVHADFIRFIESCGYRSETHASRADSCKMADFWRVDE